MSGDIWFLSDPHFGHGNILKFKDSEGNLMRGSRFKTIEEHDEYIVDACNRKGVKYPDKFYWLGDMSFRVRDLGNHLSRIKAHHRLIAGNHDDLKNYELTRHFEKIGIWRIFKEHDFVATHVPIPLDQFRYKVTYNVHGHTHQNLVMNGAEPDPRYVNVCCEHTDYEPLNVDELKSRFK
jgi:calcineurin-like phosphoesterase family protein